MRPVEAGSHFPSEPQGHKKGEAPRLPFNPEDDIITTGAKVIRHTLKEALSRRKKTAAKVLEPSRSLESEDLWEEMTPGPITEAEVVASEAIDPQFQERLKKGPSSIISQEIVEAVRRKVGESIDGVKAGKRISLTGRLVNPGATLRSLSAVAGELEADAQFRQACSREITEIMRAAVADLRQDFFHGQVESLRNQLEPYVEKYCEERGRKRPQEGTIDEIVLLFELNGVLAYIQEQGQRAEEAGRKLAERRVKIISRTSRDRQDAQLLPAATEAATEAHGAREEKFGENLSHGVRIGGIIMGLPIIAWGAACYGAEKGTENIVKLFPLTGFPLAGAFYLGILKCKDFILSSSDWRQTLLGIFLSSVALSGEVGIAVGWVKALFKKSEKTESQDKQSKSSKKLNEKTARA